MMPFSSLPLLVRAVGISWLYVLLAGFLHCAMVLWVYRRPLKRVDLPALFTSLILLFTLFCLQHDHQALAVQRAPSRLAQTVASLPWLALTLLSGIALAVLLIRAHGLIQYVKNNISPHSIREALDNLPAGLCFSDCDGLPFLTNRRMYALSKEISGKELRSTIEFWQELEQLDQQADLLRDTDPDDLVLRLANGEYWRFSRRKLPLADTTFWQTTAVHISQYYHLSQQLANRNADLRQQHIRLKQFANDLVHIKREEEILAAKIKIHSELGRCILASRYFLSHDEEDVKPILTLWEEVVARLQTSAAATDYSSRDLLGELIDIAALLGCAVEIKGDWPENEDTAQLLLAAMREAVMNAVRHGNADRVTVEIEGGDGLVAVISDNGKAAPGEISEGSGLSALRSKVERQGGQLKVLHVNGVQLLLRLL